MGPLDSEFAVPPLFSLSVVLSHTIPRTIRNAGDIHLSNKLRHRQTFDFFTLPKMLPIVHLQAIDKSLSWGC